MSRIRASGATAQVETAVVGARIAPPPPPPPPPGNVTVEARRLLASAALEFASLRLRDRPKTTGPLKSGYLRRANGRGRFYKVDLYREAKSAATLTFAIAAGETNARQIALAPRPSGGILSSRGDLAAQRCKNHRKRAASLPDRSRPQVRGAVAVAASLKAGDAAFRLTTAEDARVRRGYVPRG